VFKILPENKKIAGTLHVLYYDLADVALNSWLYGKEGYQKVLKRTFTIILWQPPKIKFFQ
jgi:hypothetical protein